MANNFKVVFFEKVQRDNGTTTQWYYSALNLIWEDLPLRLCAIKSLIRIPDMGLP